MALRRWAGILLAVLGLAAPAAAAPSSLGAWITSPRSIVFQSGGLIIPNLDPDAGVQTSAVHLAGELGLGLDYALDSAGRFSFEPSLTVYDSYYGLSDSGKAVPVGVEERDTFLLALVLDFPFGYTLPLSKALSLSGALGLAFDLRLGIIADSSVSDTTVASINSYLWDQGRFFMPSTSLRADFTLSSKLTGSVRARVLWPVYNLWAGEDLGFFDQAIFDLGLAVRYHPPAQKK